MSNSSLVKSPLVLAEARPFREPLPLTSSAAGSDQPLTVVNLLRGLRRCWRWAAGVGMLLGIIVAALVWLFLPPAKPNAFAKIYFPPVSERTRYEQADPPLKEQTQKEIILSRMILAKVVAIPEIAELQSIREQPDPVGWLSRNLGIEIASGAEIMKITLAGDRPEELQTIVNGVKDTYLREIANDAESRRTERESRYLLGLAKAEKEYESARRKVEQKSAGFGSADPQTIAYMRRRIEEQLDTAEGELKAVRLNIDRSRRELQHLTKKQEGPLDVKDTSYDPIFQTDDEIVLLVKHRKEAERRLNSRRLIVAADHPSIKEIETEIKNVQAKIDERKLEIRPSIEARVRTKTEADIAKAKDDLSAAEGLEQTTLFKIERLKAEKASMSTATLNVEGTHKDLLKLKAKVDEYELALEKLQNAKDAPVRAQTLEEAIIVRPNEASRKMRFALLGFCGVFGMTLLGFAFSEYRTRRIASPDEVEQGLGVRVMGTVPALPYRRSVSGAGQKSAEQVLWEHLIDESVDSTRTLFVHTADANDLRVVAVTSAVGGEGKTSLSCQLARSLARSGRRVLLIDGDLRNPSVHEVLGAGLQPGVSECLRNELTPAAAIRPAAVGNLFLLTAGRCDVRAIQQLAMDGFYRILQEVRPQFDFVLIDSCPVLPVADALLIARHVDGVLLSLMCDVSQVERVQTASHKLAAVGARVIGAVVHGANPDTYGYGPRYLAPIQPTA